MKRILAVYYQQDVVTEHFEQVDGEVGDRSWLKAQKKRKKPVEKPVETHQPKDFLDLIAPAAVKFNTDSYVLGGCTAVSWPPGLPRRHRGAGPALPHLQPGRRHPPPLRPPSDSGGGGRHLPQGRQQEPAGSGNQDNLKRVSRRRPTFRMWPPSLPAPEEPGPLIHCAVFLELAAKKPRGLQAAAG